MLAQQERHGLSQERWPPRQALEEHGARGIQIGSRADVMAQEPCLFRRDVPGRSHRLVADGALQACAAGEAEVDQRRPVHRRSFRDDDVRGLHVSVQDAPLVGFLEGQEHASGDGERLIQRERPAPQPLLQGDPGDERSDEEHQAVLAPEVQERRQPGAADLAQNARFVLEPLLRARGHVAGAGQLDDHLAGLGQVGPEEGLDA